MGSQDKTKQGLIEENEELKRRIRELEGNLDLSGNSERQDIPARYLGLMLDNAQEAIVVNQDETYKYANKKAAEMHRCTVEEMKSKLIREMIHPDDYEKVIANYERRVKGEQVEEFDRANFSRGKQNVVTMVNAASKVIKVEEPAKRQAGVKVGSVAELVDKLKNEAKVI